MTTDLLSHPRQLTFDIGGDHPAPGGASLAITGTGTIHSELFMGDDVTVQVVDAAGEIVASYDGACVGIQFKTHEATETTDEWVERKHVVKLGANVTDDDCACTWCAGEGCFFGSELPGWHLPDEVYPCPACRGTGSRREQVLF